MSEDCQENFKKEIVGATIKEVCFDKNWESSDNDVCIYSIELNNGKTIFFNASGQIDVDGVWASLSEND